MKPIVSYFARTFGFETVGEVRRGWNISGYKFHSRTLPEQINSGGGDPYFKPFSVKISSISTRVGFSFSEPGWHPFVQTLREYEKNRKLIYQESVLAQVFSRFNPKNVQEVLLDKGDSEMKPICDWPADNFLLSRIWELNELSLNRYLLQKDSKLPASGWIYFGPHDDRYGEKEFQRLKKVYDSIKKNGYRADPSARAAVNGYFLKNGDQVRFILLHGNHRVSALKALGYASVKVVIRKGHPAVVDRKDLKNWATENGGLYPLGLLELLFDTLFYGSGKEKARRLGLLL